MTSASASGPGRSIGNTPSQRAARRSGRRFGQRDATQTGIAVDRPRLELPAPVRGEPLEPVVEQLRARARVALLAEARRVELARASLPSADAEHEPPAAEAVERHRLARQLVRCAGARAA